MRHALTIVYLLMALASMYISYILYNINIGTPIVLACLVIPFLFLGGAATCYASSKKRYAVLVFPWVYPIALFLLLSAGYTGDL